MSPTTTPDRDLERTLDARMGLPQRHRLLHGYPLHHAMSKVEQLSRHEQRDLRDDIRFHNAPDRGLLVGVLPHPFCNPRVPGCGFCTFPHEPYRASASRELVRSVIDEIQQRRTLDPQLAERQVSGLYFGGGTANLTPADAMHDLARTLAATFDLRQAEVTLEGVPAYFLKREPPLEILRSELDARHFRISMGVQTFDPAQLRSMGREAFGDPQTFAAVTDHAHQLGATVSADLLFNLPGQSRKEMADDIRRAIGLGVDQIGLYHLVLFRNLGTTWSRDQDKLAALPDNDQACENWIALREQLLEAGFVQTSLTNFERAELHATPRRFIYEEQSFRPDQFDMLGFGPSAISFSVDAAFRSGWKTTNPTGSAAYRQALERDPFPWDRYHLYDNDGLRLFYLIRRLGANRIEIPAYEELFEQRGPIIDYPSAIKLLLERGLLHWTDGTYTPTPRGGFYADTMASLLVQVDRDRRQPRAAAPQAKRVHHEERAVAVDTLGGTREESNMAGNM